MGTGGVGGYYGGPLAQAGEDVTFIARGAHLEAIREKGFKSGACSEISGFHRQRQPITRETLDRST